MSETPLINNDKNYRVLARKYRPTNFDELIGQEAMVRTLSNAIETGRLAHAFILTGVRGVGKTTTARIIAKALNCIGPDGLGGATISPCGQCKNCITIAESQHVDVMEMDAASRTGIDDIREIIEGVRYSSVSARYKIYIIDEVHMLSRNAFNALLKTLEEPPEHVKFIFATTEIRKVPVTVLSRCQRFDLRRISIEQLTNHFNKLATHENCEIEQNALAMIARAAEGSVRDGLSLLDQAFAHCAGIVTEQQVRDMLGLADRAQVLDLYKAVMKGETASALAQLRSQYDFGADPEVILSDMLELTHWLTRLKVVPDAGEDVVTSETERSLGLEMATGLSMQTLTRTWQMLLKGLSEVRHAPSPIAATEMVLVRMTYATKLPTPTDLIKKLEDAPRNEDNASVKGDSSRSSRQSNVQNLNNPTQTGHESREPRAFQIIQNRGQARILAQDILPSQDQDYEPSPQNFKELVALFERHNEATIAFHLTENVHSEDFVQGRMNMRLKEQTPSNLIGRISELLKQWTGERWLISETKEQGEKTLYEQKELQAQQLRDRIHKNPLIKAVLEQFSDATITEIKQKIEEFSLSNDGSSDFLYENFLIAEDEFGLD
ncbi:MAG: DNA polymerase III subunit gamma/tau [Emcibacter sp.]|nr:DNA polymerase III subunit gamma/tau [Emcibacter sp.]